MGEAEDRTLRAKYLDWCSARVAEGLLDLSAEEMYALAHSEGGEAGPSSVSGDESYRALVQRATEVLLARMSLPSFSEWRREYSASPERYEAEMLGFWKEAEPD